MFSAKEARALIDDHRRLVTSLGELAGRMDVLRSDTARNADLIVSMQAMDSAISQYCTQGTDLTVRHSAVTALLNSLYEYQQILPAATTAQQLLDSCNSRIQQNITALSPATGGMKWLFAGSKAKSAAEEAYSVLSELLSGSYGASAQGLLSDARQLRQTSPVAVTEAFEADKDTWKHLLDQLCPSRPYTKGTVRCFSSLLQKLDLLQGKTEASCAGVEADKAKIEAAAIKLSAAESIRILQAVPVEELNREHSGFRVKTFRENGFATMADIHAAPVYQLAAIHGISDDAAFTAKRIAQDYAQRTRDSAHIRLSADDRSPLSTALIRTIYEYKTRQEKRAELQHLTGEQARNIQQAKAALSRVGSGLPWLFFSEGERTQVRSAYQTLHQLVDGEYAWQINRLSGALEGGIQAETSDAWRDFERNSILYNTILEEVVPGILGSSDSLYGLPEDLAREIQDEAFFPDGLLCTLRRYQEWGVKYILHQERVLLGDEMGLGKTVQAIAAMVSLKNTGASHFVVICPASVLSNWCREIPKHSKLRVTKVHGAGRAQALRSWKETGGVAVTTYETTAYFKMEETDPLDMVIVDEAHYIKNPEARRTVNVKTICKKAPRLLFMTGTALENNVEEMVALIDILQPAIAARVRDKTFMSAAPQFREQIAPVYYRRRREDVLTELPEKIETREWCTLSPAEEARYEETLHSNNFAAVRRVSWNVDDPADSSKAQRLLSLIEEAASEQRKVLVFSFFLDTIRRIGELLGPRCYGPINGSVAVARRQEIIDAFDKAPPGSVLLAQIQSGGTGLNIQSASVVVICEPQLKPSIENQAISRAYRMGQARNVLVYRLLCDDTVDERITEILETKQAIFDAFADKSVAAEQSVELDNASQKQIIQEEIDRINAKKSSDAKNT